MMQQATSKVCLSACLFVLLFAIVYANDDLTCELQGLEYKRDPQNPCTHYLQCNNGQFTSMPCASGTVFNPEIGVCDWPANVEECKHETNMAAHENRDDDESDD